MRSLLHATWIAIGLLSLGGCVPDVEDSDTQVSAPRVLAVRAEPAEAAPRDSVKLTALYADQHGVLKEGALDWGLCLARKPLSELGPISRECLVEKGKAVESFGEGLSARAMLPRDACRLFGPDQPPASEDEPAGRPVDPDVTGGYYQPLRVFDSDEGRYTTFEERIACELPRVTQAQFAEFNRRYKRNENPTIESLAIVHAVRHDEVAPAADDDAPSVKAGQAVTLRVRWPAPEHYLYFDPTSRTFTLRREGMRVSWFSTGGSFEAARTGRSEAEAGERSSDNVWTAPDQRGDVTLWIVLRDDRGGVGWQTYRFHVRP